jgi:hypothetical protein
VSAEPSKTRLVERFVLDVFGARTTGETAALFRVCYGLLACWEALAVCLNLERYWAVDGLVPWDLVKHEPYAWMSFFALAPASKAVLYGHAVLLSIASVALLVGASPRLMALVVCVVSISLQQRNPYILNSGDRLFQISAGLAALMPLGHRFSVDAWLTRRRGRPGPAPMSTYGLRLLQLEIAYVYLSSCIAKLQNPRWVHGIALRDVLSSPVYAESPRYFDFFPVVAFLTWMTLVFELAFPLLVWLKRWRPWMIAWGIAFHLGIEAAMVIPVFSAMMIVSYAVFLTDDETRALVERLRRPFARRASRA